MKYQDGLRIYGIYRFDKFPEWDIVVTGFGENENNEWVEGWAFTLDGNFQTGVSLRLPLKHRELGYIYSTDKTHNLNLSLK